jgi:hypothetical protein
MAEDTALQAMQAYYERGEETGRLDEPRGQLEFERTKEIVLRQLPPPPTTVADIGGGPGRHAVAGRVRLPGRAPGPDAAARRSAQGRSGR